MIRVRRPFILSGRLPISKSWLNRALILNSLNPELRIVEWEPSEVDGEDVTNLRLALERLASGERDFDIGESGTGFRFLLARLSRENGEFKIRGTKRLLERPHSVLVEALGKIGTRVSKGEDSKGGYFQLHVEGWPARDLQIEIDASESSQFASALCLASVGFSHSLKLEFSGALRSHGYFEMTQAMVDSVRSDRKVLVAEFDASSVATLATISVAAAHALRRRSLKNHAAETREHDDREFEARLEQLRLLVSKTSQPDRVVFENLAKMWPKAIQESQASALEPVQVDLSGAPDLFPCLAALSAFSKGTSRFYGAPHLRLKESDRIRGVAKLLSLVGISCRELEDGLEVDGISEADELRFEKLRHQGIAFEFDPESDHRLAFAAAVLAAGGVPIEVTKRGVVAKSLPLFWAMVEGDAPRVAIIGHRGSGKTEAAVRWTHALGPRATFIDLDREIERIAGRSIREIFENDGEHEFRWTEKQAWREIDAESRNSLGAVIVSCGAGFDPHFIDDSWTRIWLRRVTDEDGRIFTDRPRLNADVDPLTEFHERKKARDPRFHETADRFFEIAEGTGDPSELAWISDLFDSDIGAPAISGIGGVVTLLPHHNLSEMSERLLRWGASRIEIRDDLWSSQETSAWDLFSKQPPENLLISFRADAEVAATLSRLQAWESLNGVGYAVDWALDRSMAIPEFLRVASSEGRIQLILSWHGEAVSAELLQTLEEFERSLPRTVIKLAVETPGFASLQTLHEWMMSSRSRRVFLPMTPKGQRPRWQWYRSWLGTAAPLNFWREDEGSSLDQPTFSQWWRQRRFAVRDLKSRDFAAVLGDPVLHSRTPLEHERFFQERGLPVFSIPLSRSEMPQALEFLRKIGLRAAAVTSPLKETIEAGRALNTLAFSGEKLRVANTDDVGFTKLWSSSLGLLRFTGETIDSEDEQGATTVVWGGGGVLKSLEQTLPKAAFYSASEGRSRATGTQEASPRIVVWASGSVRGAWPASWKPRLLVDLSYTENSIGRAVALETGARYVSGLEMFEAQALAQREFWEDLK